MDVGLLIVRLVIGSLLAAHGLGKLFGWFRAGFGVAGTATYLEGLGFRPGKPWAVLLGVAEAVAGLAFAAGLLTPIPSLVIVGVTATAALTDHRPHGLWIFNGGAEYVVSIAAVAIGVAFEGAGAFSIDNAAGLSWSGTWWGLSSLLGFVASGLALAARRRPAPTAVADVELDLAA